MQAKKSPLHLALLAFAAGSREFNRKFHELLLLIQRVKQEGLKADLRIELIRLHFAVQQEIQGAQDPAADWWRAFWQHEQVAMATSASDPALVVIRAIDQLNREVVHLFFKEVMTKEKTLLPSAAACIQQAIDRERLTTMPGSDRQHHLALLAAQQLPSLRTDSRPPAARQSHTLSRLGLSAVATPLPILN